MKYCTELRERTERLRTLYGRRAVDRVFAVMDAPSEARRDFAARHKEGPCACPPLAERIKFWDAFLSETTAVHDDRVPAAYLTELDQGLYGGLVGGRASFMAYPEEGWISSMVKPILSDWDELEELRLDEDGEWAQRYRCMLDAFVQAARGRFGISHFILIDSLNFAFELVGATKTYMALDEKPEAVRRAIDFAFDLNVWVQDKFFESVPLVEDGTCSNMASWLPGRVVSESVDPFHMSSVKYYDRWGREPVERILSRYDGGIVHLHGNGRHLIEAVCATKGIRAIKSEDDGDVPPAMDVLPELRRRTGDMPLIIEADFTTFARALKEHTLVGGALYKVSAVPDKDTANRVMDEVRDYRT